MKWHLALCMVWIVLSPVLSGCWDQRLFKEVKLGMATSLDLNKKGQLEVGVSIPNIAKTSQGPGMETVQIVSVEARTPREARIKIDRETSKKFDATKMRVVLIGKSLAKKKIYPLLDIFYRDPDSPLNADLAIVSGKALNALTLKTKGESKPSEYLSGLLESAATSTFIGRNETIEGVFGKMLDPGSDITVPLINIKNQKNIAKVAGLALFDGDQYTGKVLKDQAATLFLLMNNDKGKIARLTAKVLKNQKPKYSNYITIEVKKAKSNLKIQFDELGKISAKINLHLKVRTIEYPRDRLDTKKEVDKLNRRLSQLLSRRAGKVINKLQKADCDAYGIGRHLNAFHHDLWKTLDWEKVYPKIPFTAKVDVEIVQHGIIN
ncbi:MAG TPA: Ger(x)C family spore germination protein [Bacillales bacterium]|nr:Ger(x)C family spore germination protein [Bacillales bacterium]